ncbi:divalent metal cation transporter [Edaphobacter paludis]|uniref:Divalent metal cation transporter n=1 Tax=Edaphobacter paludis TaxID=3035702 RepID=A0AAU7D3T9_9BACT
MICIFTLLASVLFMRSRHAKADYSTHPRFARLHRIARLFGPGLVTGAADDDPSGILTYSQSGAQFGLGQLWTALVMLPFLIAVQEMSARIALVTGQGIAATLRKHYSRHVLYGIVFLLIAANTINLGADLGAMADSAHLLLPIPNAFFILLFATIAIVLEVFVQYRTYAPMLKLLTLSLFAYMLTGLIATRDWTPVIKASFLPHIQFDYQFLMIIVGVFGTTISPYCFFWQASQELEERRAGNGGSGGARRLLADMQRDTSIGMFASEVATWFIIETTAVVLYVNGVRDITTSAQAARALDPLVESFPHAGKISEILFAAGVIGTGALAVPIFAAVSSYALCELLEWNEGLDLTPKQAPGFYWIMLAGTSVGVLQNYLGFNPIKLLIYSAVINGIVSVPIIFMLIIIANNSKIMGKYANRMLSNVISIATLAVMTISAGLMMYSFFAK